MEAALFTLDVLLLLVLIVAVRRSDRQSGGEQRLGFFSFLEAKTDPIQKGLKPRKGADDA